MSIRLRFRDGVFEPLDDAIDAKPVVIYTAFSDEGLRDFVETLGWTKPPPAGSREPSRSAANRLILLTCMSGNQRGPDQLVLVSR